MPASDEYLRRQQEHIHDVGWSVTAVVPEPGDTDATFAYTVGLTERRLPELIIAGLHPLIAHELLNDLAHRLHGGMPPLVHDQRLDDLIVGYDVAIVDGLATEALHPGTAYARYGKDRVRLRQIVWPDKHGRFPWDDGYAYPPHVQPLLARP